jgi:hypothetical protein
MPANVSAAMVAQSIRRDTNLALNEWLILGFYQPGRLVRDATHDMLPAKPAPTPARPSAISPLWNNSRRIRKDSLSGSPVKIKTTGREINDEQRQEPEANCAGQVQAVTGRHLAPAHRRRLFASTALGRAFGFGAG